jgi:hypothetical protein
MEILCEWLASWLYLYSGNENVENSEIGQEGEEPSSQFRKIVTTEIQGLETALEIRKQNPLGAKVQNLRG